MVATGDMLESMRMRIHGGWLTEISQQARTKFNDK
jgi:hypothetical protein